MRNLYHASDLRKGRHSAAGQIYLVTTVTHRRQPLFEDLYTGRQAVKALCSSDREGSARTLAFVVMPDHLHWLIALGEGKPLSQVVADVKRRSAWRINAMAGRTGRSVWQRGFHDRALRSEESIRDAARYVVANPLRAGLVRTICDYPLWDAAWL